VKEKKELEMLEDPGQGKMCRRKVGKTYSDFVVLEEMFGKNGVYCIPIKVDPKTW